MTNEDKSHPHVVLLSFYWRLIVFWSLGFAVLGTVICVLISLFYHFEGTTATQCGVYNFLPSLSAAIGGRSPQRYIWRISIALHSSPRLVTAILYYCYYSRYPAAQKGIWHCLAVLVAVCHCVENIALLLLSYISSTDNYAIHEFSFITFIASSQLYMILSCSLYKKVHNKQWMQGSAKSYWYKLRLWLVNVLSLIFAAYFFYRHNTYCEPGVYSIFALCEYSVVFSNIAFHWTACMDFANSVVKVTQKDEKLTWLL